MRWPVLPLAAVAALALRHRMLRWGATPAEVAAEYPGDTLVPAPTGCSTMATTLEAPRETVWCWLVQMGADRAGWYSWDRLDNRGRPSATRIVPKWQDLRVGDRVNATVDGRMYFTVAIIDRRDAPRPLMAVTDFLVGQPAHLIMQARQFANLRRRLGAAENTQTSAGVVSDHT
ncbi:MULTISPECIES: hypothetical protein [Nocardia]|uniref:hypothetical protein n=1 Tax=Nocardia TaxID=1817 RepID=UPI00135C7008|nr:MULTISPECIES: hypothetical protein [Nocardia]